MQVVLLTGGAGGLARALADLVLTRGGRVWLCDLAAEAVTAAVATLRAKHAEAGLGGCQLDVRSADQWEAAWKVTLCRRMQWRNESRVLDILVNDL